MPKQLILAMGREFGSGGHLIAETLAQRFGIPLYENNMLRSIAETRDIDPTPLLPYDETPQNPLFYRTVGSFNSSPSDALAQMQFRFLREQANAGKSFVVVGRCGEEVLREFPGLISIFVLADTEFKVTRLLELGAGSREEAIALMTQQDRKRKTYHNQYCRSKWGDSHTYDLCFKSSCLGLAASADLLEAYVRARIVTNGSK